MFLSVCKVIRLTVEWAGHCSITREDAWVCISPLTSGIRLHAQKLAIILRLLDVSR
jgi:hypothetical protein